MSKEFWVWLKIWFVNFVSLSDMKFFFITYQGYSIFDIYNVSGCLVYYMFN